jgi:hypothetical protein
LRADAPLLDAVLPSQQQPHAGTVGDVAGFAQAAYEDAYAAEPSLTTLRVVRT